jgi:hypothetical protein
MEKFVGPCGSENAIGKWFKATASTDLADVEQAMPTVLTSVTTFQI